MGRIFFPPLLILLEDCSKTLHPLRQNLTSTQFNDAACRSGELELISQKCFPSPVLLVMC